MNYSLKSFIAGLIALVGAFLVLFIFPDFEYNDTLGLVATIAGFIGVTNFRAQFEAAVNLFKTKTIYGAILTGVPMVIFALAGFFGFNLPAFLAEALKYLVEVGGGWMLLGTSHVLAKNIPQTK